MPIQERMHQCQIRVEQLLDRYLGPEKASDVLVRAMRYSALQGGKRLRPLLVYLTAEMFNTPLSVVDPIAAAIECVHCYSLIHDDLPAMDNDDFRRGKPTCHKVFGDAVAILAGDALLTLAVEILCQDNHVPTNIIALIAKASGRDGMIMGQTHDLAAENQTIDLNELMAIHRAKTGALITASVMAAGLMSHITPEEAQALTAFGDAIGLAFQIQDDILDAIGDPNTMGKQSQQDLRSHKNTFVILLGLAEAQKQAQNYYQKSLDALSMFGDKAQNLRELSAFIIQRAL